MPELASLQELAPFWIALALEKSTLYITIAACADNRRDVLREAQQRMPQGTPILGLNLISLNIGDKISTWLADHDVLGAQNVAAVRDIGKELAHMFDQIAQDRGWKGETP